ncbi:hypothetical protein [Psychrobacter sp. I-STPA10]|uniref:hypothetical protein n=1 Tax=Psychrobacter sp. I-STPA10 TaxID=2585769 RepID=UPI001E2D5F3F|nr:hypothetical protein [Psychrobacter sp. I-STPA10]
MIGDTVIFEPDFEKIKYYLEEEHEFKFEVLWFDVITMLELTDIIDIPIDIDETVSYDEHRGYLLSKLNPKAVSYIFERYPTLTTLKNVDDLDEDDPLYQLGDVEISDLIKLYEFTSQHGIENLYLYSTF